MKNINFVTTLSPLQQYEIRRWFIWSLFLVISTLIAITYLIAPHLYCLYTTKKEIATLQQKTHNHGALVSKKETLKKENEVLQKKRAKINRYLNQPNNPYAYLRAITTACETDAKIEHVRKNKENIEVGIVCTTPERATAIITKLSDTNLFSALKLASLQHDPVIKKFRCVIKGKTTK